MAAVTESQWRRVGPALGLDDLADDERFATAVSRHRHRRSLEERLQAVFLTAPASRWTVALDQAGVPNQVPIDTDDGRVILRDEDNVALGWWPTTSTGSSVGSGSSAN